MTSRGTDITELLGRDAWLRALARQLVAGSDTDDVVQETWLAAAGAPDRIMPGFLASVLCRRAARVHRDRERRDRREGLAARKDQVQSTLELVAQVELRRELALIVTQLEDPYRTVILLRFYEGHSHAEIARRMDRPIATIRSWTQRGLVRLRKQLGEQRGEDWRMVLLPLCGGRGIGLLALTTVLCVAGLCATGAWFVLRNQVASSTNAQAVQTAQIEKENVAQPASSAEPRVRDRKTIKTPIPNLPAETEDKSSPPSYGLPSIAQHHFRLIYPPELARFGSQFELAVGQQRLAAITVEPGSHRVKGAGLDNSGDLSFVTPIRIPEAYAEVQLVWKGRWNHQRISLGTHHFDHTLPIKLVWPTGISGQVQLKSPEPEWSFKDTAVEFTSKMGRLVAVVAANSSGDLNVPYLPPGAYSIRATEASARYRWNTQAINLREGETFALELHASANYQINLELPGGSNLRAFHVVHLASNTRQSYEVTATTADLEFGLVAGDYQFVLVDDRGTRTKRVQVYANQRMAF